MNGNQNEFPSNSLGAIAYDAGVYFRVWAPHADAVSVMGEFNNWDAAANPCDKDEGGNWSTMVPQAKPGQGYKFAIRTGERRLLRIDPRARQVTNSVGHGIITIDDFDWQGDDFRMPR